MSDAESKGLVLMLKGVISDLPEADQARIKKHVQTLRDLIASEPSAVIAIALVSAEISDLV